MRKVKFEDIFPKSIDMDLVLKILKDRMIEVGKIEGKKGFVVFGASGKPLSQKQIWKLVKDDYSASIIIEYFIQHAKKGDIAQVDFKNKQLIIYEHDKDKEIEEVEKELREEPDKEEVPIYIR